MDFKERLEKVTLRNMKVKHIPKKMWPIEKRIEVVSQWLVLGNMKQVSVLTGVSYDLIREWKGKPWWAELEQEIRATQNIEMDTKLSRIVDKSLDAVLDRVENGDFIYDQKSGEVRRKPAALRDIHRVAVDTLSKRELIRQEEKQTIQQKISMEEHLKMLAQEMAKWMKKDEVTVIDVEVTDVTPKEEIEDESEISEAGSDAGEICDYDELEDSDELVDEGEEGDSGQRQVSGASDNE